MNSLAEFDALGRWVFNNIGQTRVFISGFQSGNAAIDNWMNQSANLIDNLPSNAVPGIGINGLDTGTTTEGQNFSITLSPQVDISPLVPAAPPTNNPVTLIPSKTPITVRFSASRVRIPCRFRRIVQRLTNYGS